MENNNPIVIYGAGKNGLCALHYLRSENIKQQILFCDNDESKWGETIEDISVLSFEAIKRIYGEDTGYILAGTYADDIARELKKRGIHKKKIFRYGPKITRIGNIEYSFDVPIEFLKRSDNRIVYSFGIGEDLSFSDEIMNIICVEMQQIWTLQIIV